MSISPHEYLTVAEAAELLRVSVSTIRRWIRTGSITAHRAGQRRLLLRRADVTRAMRAVGPTTNGATRGYLSPTPWDRDESRRTAAARAPELRTPEEANGLAEQTRARLPASGIMTPEAWELIREGRELRTDQVMKEIDPKFDDFDLGVVTNMIVHSPDRPRPRLLTLDEQRQMLDAIEHAARTRERIRQRSGVDRFPPSEDIIAEMREERTRQLLGEDEPAGERAT